MNRIILLVSALFLVCGVSSANIIEYPIANDYYFGSDTLHVTTVDTKWHIGTGTVYALTIINPNNIQLISIKIKQGTSVSTIGTFCGAYGTLYIEPPNLMGPGIDSLWIDASAAGTVYIQWWEVK
jgi:hypothetical protein